MNQDLKTERKTIRLTKKQMEALESKIKHTGHSFSELVVKKIIDNEDTAEITGQIVWESEQVQEKIDESIGLQKNFSKDFIENLKEIKQQIKSSQVESIYAIYAELQLTDKTKANIYTYKKGDLIRTNKNNLLGVVSVNVEANELEVTLMPLSSEPKFQVMKLKEKASSFTEVFRP